MVLVLQLLLRQASDLLATCSRLLRGDRHRFLLLPPPLVPFEPSSNSRRTVSSTLQDSGRTGSTASSFHQKRSGQEVDVASGVYQVETGKGKGWGRRSVRLPDEGPRWTVRHRATPLDSRISRRTIDGPLLPGVVVTEIRACLVFGRDYDLGDGRDVCRSPALRRAQDRVSTLQTTPQSELPLLASFDYFSRSRDLGLRIPLGVRDQTRRLLYLLAGEFAQPPRHDRGHQEQDVLVCRRHRRRMCGTSVLRRDGNLWSVAPSLSPVTAPGPGSLTTVL